MRAGCYLSIQELPRLDEFNTSSFIQLAVRVSIASVHQSKPVDAKMFSHPKQTDLDGGVEFYGTYFLKTSKDVYSILKPRHKESKSIPTGGRKEKRGHGVSNGSFHSQVDRYVAAEEKKK